MAEAGVPNLEVYSWQAVAAPRGLPADVRARLETELVASAHATDVKARFEQIGFDVVGSTGAEFEAFLTGEIARWREVIETGNITAN
jgi:tripartite-type tricarboxylate transporter receptor subunit TctC